jgi:peptidoglycan/LPS O-acetylase OafA/YrhL
VSYSLGDLTLKLGIIFLLMYCLLGLKVSNTVSRISSELGKRAYALYVVHGPIVGVLLALWRPDSFPRFIGFFMSALVSTTFATECAYRYIDRWAIEEASKKLRKSN